MNTIALEGMRFWAQHGFYDEERILSGWYSVDIYVTTNFKKAATEDELGDTINYEIVYLVTKFQMAKPVRLIETVAYNILSEIKHKFGDIQKMRIRITKHNPPMVGDVTAAIVEIEEDYNKTCAKCKGKMLCYNDKNCFCHQIHLSPAVQRILQQQYNGCLCKKCLKEYTH
jgi:7,8-dihydroneopterin aldolase/epimerase/oxygenase